MKSKLSIILTIVIILGLALYYYFIFTSDVFSVLYLEHVNNIDDSEIIAQIIYTNETKKDLIFEQKVDKMPQGQLKINIKELKKGYFIKDITLYKKINDNKYPIDWFSVEDGIKIEKGLNINFEKNEFAGGNGTSIQPYLVGNPKQLNNVKKHLDSHFKQIRDIDFENSFGIKIVCNNIKDVKDLENHQDIIKYEIKDNKGIFFNNTDEKFANYAWQPIGNEKDKFLGKYDGNNKTIDNLLIFSINNEKNVLGLFGICGVNSELKNINIGKNSIIYIDSSSDITIGGIVGNCLGNISECSNNGKIYLLIEGNKNAIQCGAISGFLSTLSNGSQAKIVKCKNTGIITTIIKGNENNCYIGGITGENKGKLNISECKNSGNIHTYSEDKNIQSIFIGGISGINGEVKRTSEDEFSDECNIEKCVNSTDIKLLLKEKPMFYNSNYSVGGIVGKNNGNINLCINKGNIDSDVVSGGIVGYNDYSVTKCINKGNISSLSCAGGIVGFTSMGRPEISFGYNKAILRCCNIGNILGKKNSSRKNETIAGGIVGINDMIIESSLNYGNVKADTAGGIVAHTIRVMEERRIFISCNFGKITSYDDLKGERYYFGSGGIIGSNGGELSQTLKIDLCFYSGSKVLVGVVFGIDLNSSDKENYLESEYLKKCIKENTASPLTEKQMIGKEKIKKYTRPKIEHIYESEYLIDILHSWDNVWIKNPKEDDKLGKGIKKGMPILDFMLEQNDN